MRTLGGLLLGTQVGAEQYSCALNPERDSFEGGKFPDDFIWSFATASYQIEGAWDADGKGENIWDRFSHQGLTPDEYRLQKDAGTFVCPENPNVEKCDNGDVACNSYNEWERDIQLIKDLGVENYRFSISWSRLCPTGYCDDEINEDGVNFYKKFIENLKANNIEPFVTLYHWDLPQNLQDKRRGWADENGDEPLGINTAFRAYAKLCFDRFGDNVKQWITFNEAEIVADLGYGIGVFAPGIADEKQKWRARHNTVRSHAEAVEEYRAKFRASDQGIIGITINTDHYIPKSNSANDIKAADLQFELQAGFWAEPIYGSGDYSDKLKSAVEEQFPGKNFLPKFTPEQIAKNKDSADFFGLNHYTSSIMSWNENNDFNLQFDSCSNWQIAGSSWLKKVPYGFGDLLRTIDYKYDSSKYPIYVTENGLSSNHRFENPTNGTDQDPNLNDEFRIDFYHQYIGQMKKAMDEGVNVKAYTAWSLLDNFEWASGYAERFGLHWTNYTDPNRSITQKESAKWFGKVAQTNSIEAFVAKENDEDNKDDNSEDNASSVGLSLLVLIFLAC